MADVESLLLPTSGPDRLGKKVQILQMHPHVHLHTRAPSPPLPILLPHLLPSQLRARLPLVDNPQMQSMQLEPSLKNIGINDMHISFCHRMAEALLLLLNVANARPSIPTEAFRPVESSMLKWTAHHSSSRTADQAARPGWQNF